MKMSCKFNMLSLQVRPFKAKQEIAKSLRYVKATTTILNTCSLARVILETMQSAGMVAGHLILIMTYWRRLKKVWR